MTALTQELHQALRRLDFPEFVRQVQTAYEEERRRREQFREDLGVKFEHGEFINGEVVLPSPMKFRHRRVLTRFASVGEAFINQGGSGLFETGGLLIRTTRNDYEPDVYYWPEAISNTFTPDQTVFPPPAFIAEILSPSTQERDRGVKFEDYAAHGVSEYWIIDPDAQTVECYDLADGRYTLREKVSVASDATLRCRAIEGLAFSAAALFDDDVNRKAVEAIRGAGRG
jgi:Uma2 family endonuclease